MANKTIRGITIEIGGDTTKLGKALEDSEKKSRSLQTELTEIQKGLKFDTTNVELLSQKQTVLTQNIEETSKKLDVLKEAEKQVIAQFERGEVAEEQVRALKREIEKTEGVLGSMKTDLDNTTKSLKDLADGTDSAEKHTKEYADSLKEAEEELAGFKEKASETFDTLKTGATVLAGAVTAVAGYAVNLSTEFEKAFNTLQTQTGATAEEMDGLEASMTNIYRNNFGENMEDIAQSMAIVKTQTKLSGEELEQVTTYALLMRDTFDFEVNESIRAVNSLMNQFGISAEEAYNLIAQGAQKGLNQNDDLLDTINEYSVQFEMLGFSADDMFNMLANGAESGTWSVDKLGDAVKEFNIRAKDGSESTAGAFQALGLVVGDNSEFIENATENIEKYSTEIAKLEKNIKYAEIQQAGFNEKTSELTKTKTSDNIAEWKDQLAELQVKLKNSTEDLERYTAKNAEGGQTTYDLMTRFAEGGESAKQATQEVISALLAMEDQVHRDAIGVSLFGTMWEDLGADAIGALLTTQGELSSTSDALQKINETKYDDIGSALQGLGRTLQADVIDPLGDELTPVIEEAIDYVNANGPAIKEVLSNIVTAIGDFVRLVVDNKDAIIGTIVAVGAGFIAWNVVTMIQGVVGAIKAFTLANQGATIAQTALNMVMNANPIALVITAITALVAGFIYFWNTSEEFRQFWIDLWETIKNAVSVAIEAIVTFFSNAWTRIVEVWGLVSQWFSDLWTSITEIFANVVEWFGTTFTNAWNKIVEVWGLVSAWFADLWAKIVEIFTPAVEWFSALFSSIYDTLSSIVAVIIELVRGCWILITTIFGIALEWFTTNVIEPVKEAFTKFWNTIRDLASKAWAFISEVFSVVANWFSSKVIEPVRNAFTKFWDKIKSLASSTWSGIKSIWTAVSGWFNKTIISPVSNFFSNMWKKLKSGASDAWTGIKNVFSTVTSWFKDKFSSAWTAVKNVFSSGGKIFSGIKEGIADTFKTVVNGIISGINKVISVPFGAINGALSTIRNISIAGISPFSGLPSISTPQIPLLYRGGILKRGQVGLLEGNGSEAVVPLEKETGWINRIAQKMNEYQATTPANTELVSKMDEMIRTFKTVKSAIVLDTGVLVGETINQIDAGLSNNYTLRERRV